MSCYTFTAETISDADLQEVDISAEDFSACRSEIMRWVKEGLNCLVVIEDEPSHRTTRVLAHRLIGFGDVDAVYEEYAKKCPKGFKLEDWLFQSMTTDAIAHLKTSESKPRTTSFQKRTIARQAADILIVALLKLFPTSRCIIVYLKKDDKGDTLSGMWGSYDVVYAKH